MVAAANYCMFCVSSALFKLLTKIKLKPKELLEGNRPTNRQTRNKLKYQ